MLVKCKYCGKSIDKKDAIAIRPKGSKRNSYYCSQEHVSKVADKDKFYMKAMDIIGKTTSSIFMKEMNEIASVHGYKKMFNYLTDNEWKVRASMNRVEFNTEFNKIRYFSAILKNNLGEYKFNEKKEIKREVHVEEDNTYNFKKEENVGLDDILGDLL